jgi:NAD-binding of NADP-dependent 3-hydroxyisobutyrate dehydrogenase
MGPPTAGIRMKLVVNLLLGIGMEAIAEAVSLGEHLKLDRGVLLDVLPMTAVVAPAFSGKFAKIISGDYSAQFPLHLMAKDLGLAETTAKQWGAELPIGSATRCTFEEALAKSGELDISAIASSVSTLEVGEAARNSGPCTAGGSHTRSYITSGSCTYSRPIHSQSRPTSAETALQIEMQEETLA